MDERLRVLVVEDNHDQALLVGSALRRHTPPMDVTLVGTAKECLNALATASYAAIVLDHHLPGTTGLQLLHAIQANGTAVPPIVMVTGQGDERIAVDAMKAGAADYVIKTVGYFASLPASVAKAVRQHELARENARLDREARRRLRETEGLLAVSQALSATLDSDELARRATRELCILLEAESVAYLTLDSSSATLRYQVGWGSLIDLGEAVLSSIDLEALCTTRAVPRALRSCVHVCVPVGTADRCFGVLVVRGSPGSGGALTETERLVSGVAEQMALALENARLYEETQRALGEVERAQEQLVQSHTLRALGEMAAGTAHHLNNLLAVALGRLQLMGRTIAASSVAAPGIDTIEQALTDAASVIRRMQRFARPSTGGEALEPVDLQHIAEEARALTETPCVDEFQARGISIVVRVEGTPVPVVRASAPGLREIVTNLILNAVDAMPQGGIITLRTFERRGRACLSVSDTGTGMAPAVKQRALEPFFTTKGPKGTGLGLSVAYGVMQRHGGELEIESAEDAGTTVTLSLPPVPEPVPPPSIVSRHEHLDADCPPKRVLVVDDDDRVRALLGTLLQADGHCVLQARSGPESISVLERGVGIDLVMTDHGMPGMTGLDLTRTIKARWPTLRVGVITGWGEDLAVPGSNVGPDFILAKPVNVSTLRAAIAGPGALSTR